MVKDDLIIHRAVCARVPTAVGEFQLCLYTNNRDSKEHLALINGDITDKENVLVRIHSECFTGDVLGSRRCDCGEQLRQSMEMIALEGCGVIVYLRQEGRGIGLAEKLRAYNLQDDGLDTVDANLALGHPVDERDYSMAAAILKDLEVCSIRLITNNPTKLEEIEARGIKVTDRIALISTVYEDNMSYLLTKVQRMNHLLTMTDFVLPLSGRGNGKD
jgi:GTP cyclohydrolase II